MPHGLPRKLKRAFILHAVMASLAIVIGIYATGSVVKEVLAGQRLHLEADALWRGRMAQPEWPKSETLAVQSYFVASGQPLDPVPVALRKLQPGVHSMEKAHGRVLVQDRAAGRLYVVMHFYLLDSAVRWTSIGATVLALIAIYIVTWLTYRRSNRLVVPVNWLARQVSRWDPSDPEIRAIAPERLPGGDSEVLQLGTALHDLSARIRDFVQRERDFTRDASHELRTPLTVIRVATDMLLSDPETPERAQRSLLRMQRAGRDMEAVIDAFLILARESGNAPLAEDFEVAEVVGEEVDKVRPLLEHRPVELEVIASSSPRLHAPPRVLAVMLGQLLDNACIFTEQGRIEVRIEADRLIVRDTGIGMTKDVLHKAQDPFYRANQFNQSGKGMGLSIVRRLADRFGWPLTLESTPGTGTIATIGFADHLVR